MSASWKEIAERKKASQLDSVPKDWLLSVSELPDEGQLNVTSIPRECSKLSALEVEITESRVSNLLINLAASKWSSMQVTTAFYKRAIIAQQLTNCLTEIFVPRALARAKELDEYLARTGKVMGSLHGLPVSVKDQVGIKGIESTIGYVSWIGNHAKKNSVLIDILESLGAVPFVKTQIPQTLMWPETFNHVFGRTLNPHNRSLTSGGSSGGEGTLLALKGSPLGVGSDIGGSIRIPAGFCGLYGFRPSYNRIPYEGCVNTMQGMDAIPSVLGPLCNSLEGTKIFFQAVLSQEPWKQDAATIRKPWSEREYDLADHGSGERLCFGIMWDDGRMVPHPPVLRGLRMAKEALVRAGHKVIDWVPYKHSEITENMFNIWNAAATEDYEAVTSISGEPVISSMELSPSLSTDSELDFRPGHKARATSAFELWQFQKQKGVLRQEHLRHWAATENSTGTGRPVDAIICPMAAYTAPPHGMNKSAQYTMPWNLLDSPAMIIPVANVDPVVDAKQLRTQFYSRADRANHEQYDPAIFKDAPITIQVVGRTMEDEAVIRMSEIVDQALQKNLKSKL